MIEDNVEQALTALLAQESPKNGKRSELRAAIEKHKSTIQQALSRKFTPTAIARAIRESGVPVGIGTIREYVAEVGTSGKRMRKRGTQSTRKRTPQVLRESLQPEGESVHNAV
jgi:hypothetical protein